MVQTFVAVIIQSFALFLAFCAGLAAEQHDPDPKRHIAQMRIPTFCMAILLGISAMILMGGSR